MRLKYLKISPVNFQCACFSRLSAVSHHGHLCSHPRGVWLHTPERNRQNSRFRVPDFPRVKGMGNHTHTSRMIISLSLPQIFLAVITGLILRQAETKRNDGISRRTKQFSLMWAVQGKFGYVSHRLYFFMLFRRLVGMDNFQTSSCIMGSPAI